MASVWAELFIFTHNHKLFGRYSEKVHCGVPVFDAKPLLIMILPAGGFFAVGLLMGLFNWVSTRNGSKGIHR
jgi:Na+-translocating ferredoxin:NAD+ oxidoreductase RnfE subunit